MKPMKLATVLAKLIPGMMIWVGVAANGSGAIDLAAGRQVELVAKPAMTEIPLKGISSGGTLELKSLVGEYPSGALVWITVTNQAGDTAIEVANRLVQSLHQNVASAKVICANDLAIVVLPGGSGFFGAEWLLGGTGRGFNIPAPPKAVTASYSPTTGNITVTWQNTPEEHDSVGVYWSDRGLYRTAAFLPGTNTSVTFKPLGGPHSGTFPLLVIGYKGNVPSAAVHIQVNSTGKLELLFDVPFAWGVAPGFETWEYGGSASALKFFEGDPLVVGPTAEMEFVRRRSVCQVLECTDSGCGGVLRRFLGLRGGRVYRVNARLAVLDRGKGDWSFTMHAAAEPAGRVRFTDA